MRDGGFPLSVALVRPWSPGVGRSGPPQRPAVRGVLESGSEGRLEPSTSVRRMEGRQAVDEGFKLGEEGVGPTCCLRRANFSSASLSLCLCLSTISFCFLFISRLDDVE